MKKIISIVLTALMITGALVIGASADSYIYNQNEELTVVVKKADSANVIKDGVISDGEYEHFVVDNNPESENCELAVVFDDSEYFDKAEAMMKTAEFYFSWDDTHGFNIAARYKPETIYQVRDIKSGDTPADDFLLNTGVALFLDYRHDYGSSNMKLMDVLYYAIAKRTTDGKYLQGHYNQLGINGNYTATAEKDFIISYGSDGYVTVEWSVPIETVISGSYGAGTNLYFTLSLMAGDADGSEGGYDDFYGVELGYYGYAMKNGENNHVTATLSDETITATGNGDIGGGDSTGGNGGSTTHANNNGGSAVVDDNGNVVPVSDNGNTNGNTSSTKTGDAVLVLALSSILSGAGVMLGKKKRK